ncbi:hypothetical protein P5673_018076 [Acropora cervicornis]|uniref:Uncharacterized protein n=1 Tax=Acropora cervicornis TaxID=6130 RepID=A0AAD9V337_ACRCE|nr:hypothetical protein P5673_018076 [Acropora cervicornis]
MSTLDSPPTEDETAVPLCSLKRLRATLLTDVEGTRLSIVGHGTLLEKGVGLFFMHHSRGPDRKLQRGSVSEEVEPDMAVAKLTDNLKVI